MIPQHTINELAVFGGVSFFDSPKPNSGLYLPSKERFLAYAEKIFKSRHVTNNGPLVQQLEARLAALHKVERCVTFCSGFMALVLAIKSMALDGRTHVIMPSATYRKMTDIVRWAGFSPFFVDISSESLGMTADLTAPYIGADTALVLAAHPIVNHCDLLGLEQLCADRGVPLLVDAVEAAYGSYLGRRIGSFGNAEAFSMHASKFINGFEGGYVTTNDQAMADSLKTMRAFGFYGVDNIVGLGLNAKLNELHAAMSLSCLDELEENIRHNKEVYDCYLNALCGLPLTLVKYSTENEVTWKNIVVKLDASCPYSSTQLLALLNAEKMLSRAYYSPLLHEDMTDYLAADLSNSIAASQSHIILPSGAQVSKDDVFEIVKFLQYAFDNSTEILNAMCADHE